jgi:hypothetical protein
VYWIFLQPTFNELVQGIPAVPPGLRLAWQAVVDIAPRQALGACPQGERFIVPITGGWFEGGLDGHVLRGHIVPGGADRQRVRPDGVRELDALYEMQTDDGNIITIHNRVLIDESMAGQRYAMSHITVTAPDGPYGWLNRRVFAGTLHPLRPAREAVLVRAWLLG